MDYFELTQQEIEEFTGDKAGYYLEKWQKYPETSLFAGWNGVAFFLTYYWAVFRKMYAISICAVLYTGILGFITGFGIGIGALSLSPIRFVPILLLGIAPNFFFGFLGNGLYRRKAIKAVSQTTSMDEDEKKVYLNKTGNVSNKGVLILLSVIVATNLLSYYISYTDAFGSDTVIISECGRFSAEIPAAWIELKDYELNDEAALQAFHKSNNAYFMMLTDTKEDIDYDFDEWIDLVFGWKYSSMPGATISESIDFVIGDRPARWWAVTDHESNTIYLFTYIDGENHFGQVLCWSPARYYTYYDDTFVDIILSIEGL